jgi:hypothetical protein
MTINELRTETENFFHEISKEFYLQGAGLKDEIKLKEIYSKYPQLSSRESINLILLELKNTDDPDSKKKLNLLLENMYNSFISSQLTSISEDLIYKETTGVIEIDGKEKSFRSSFIDLINTDDREKREIIKNKRDEFITAELNPLYRKEFETENDLIKDFGFENKIKMFEVLSEIDLNKLNEEMQSFLKRSESIYTELLGFFVKKKLSIPLSGLKQHDLQFILRAKDYDMFFPPNDLISNTEKFITSMGLDLQAGNNITFDLESRVKKSPRAFCSPVKIPGEIYLVINPRGGVDDYFAFMHELGHALHYANIDSDLSFEYKWLGDNSITEGFAMTFDHLTLDPVWMKKILNVGNKDYLIQRAFNELFMIRRYAGKLQYEMLLAESGKIDGMENYYTEILSAATKSEYSASGYLIDVDGYFYVARYLRAWMFQANMHKYLKENYNEDWFLNPKSGKVFLDMWSSGQKLNTDELLLNHQCSQLSTKPLLEKIEEMIN